MDYDPTTTVGATTVGVSLSAAAGPEGPSVGFSVSWSYTVSDVRIYDLSDFSIHRAYWQHDIDKTANVAIYTYLAKPGFVVKTKQNSWSFVDGWYKVRWVAWIYLIIGGTWFSKELESSTLYLDVLKTGDQP